MPHEITVKALKVLLEDLLDDDVLVPNDVRNLAILRDDKQIGFVNLLKGQPNIELYEQ